MTLANRVRELTLTTGTGDITLGGALVAHIKFADAFTVGDTVTYVIEDGDNYEIGSGTLTAPDTLVRTVVGETLVDGVYDKAGPSAIELSGGALVFCAVTAEFLLDSTELADVISEVTPGAGVLVDGALIKDGAYTAQGADAIFDAHVVQDTMAGTIPVHWQKQATKFILQAGGVGDLVTFDLANLGTTFAGDLSLSATNILRDVDNSTLRLGSSSGTGIGANLILYGGTNATNANNIVFRSGTTDRLSWSDSGSKWAMSGRLDVTSISSLNSVFQANTTSQMTLSAGSSPTTGANMRMHGQSHATYADKTFIRYDEVNLAEFGPTLATFNTDVSATNGLSVGAALVDKAFEVHGTGSRRFYVRNDGVVAWNPTTYGGELSWDTNKATIKANSNTDHLILRGGGPTENLVLDELGNVEVGNDLTLVGTNFTRGVANSFMRLAGGSHANDGGGLFLYGSTHSTAASDVILKSTSSTIAHYDASLGNWNYQDIPLTGLGGLQISAGDLEFDSTGRVLLFNAAAKTWHSSYRAVQYGTLHSDMFHATGVDRWSNVNAYFSTSAVWKRKSTGTATTLNQTTTGVAFKYASGGVADTDISFIDKWAVDGATGDMAVAGHVSAGDGKNVCISGPQNSYIGLVPDTDINLMIGTGASSEPRIYLYGGSSGSSSAGDIFIGTANNTGNVEISGTMSLAGTDFTRTVANSFLRIAGGNSANDGGGFFLYGSTHSTAANDVVLKSNGNVIAQWDASANYWNYNSKNIVGIPSISRGISSVFLQLSGGTNGDNGGNIALYGESHTNANDILFRAGTTGRLRWDESSTVWDFQATRASNIYALSRGTSTGNFNLSGGSSATQGANLYLYAEGHASNPGDILFRSDTTNVLFYDHSSTTWNFQSGFLTGVSDLSVNSEAGMHRTNETSLIKVSGGSSGNSGMVLRLYGNNHASAAYDFGFRKDAGDYALYYDDSLSLFTLDGDVLVEGISNFKVSGEQNSYKGIKPTNDINLTFGTGAGAEPRMYLFGSANGQASAGNIYIATANNTGTIELVGTAKITSDLEMGGSGIYRASTNDVLRLSGGSSESLGFNWAMYGESHVSRPNGLLGRSGTTGVIEYKDGASAWSLLGNVLNGIGPGNTVSMIVGADSTGTSQTNSVNKAARIAVPHYLTAEEPAAIVLAQSTSSQNLVQIGGGTSHMNAATDLYFYTATNNTTTTGTLQWLVTSAGDLAGEGGNLIRRGTNAGTMAMTGGLTASQGGAVTLYGNTHAGFANDIAFSGAGSTKLAWDHSADLWDYKGNVVTGVSDLTVSANGNAANLTIQRTNAGSADSGIGNIEYANNVDTVMARINVANGTSTSDSNMKFWVRNASEGLTQAAEIKEDKSLNLEGSLCLGNEGSLTLAANEITITKSFHKVAVESGATDNLEVINGGANGTILYLRAATDSGTIVVKNTSTIRLAGGADFSMDLSTDIIQLIKDDTLWLEVTRSNNG